MDLILFPTYEVPSTLFAHVQETGAAKISAEAFAEWPEHMRREFAALTAEAGIADDHVRERTGITPEALERARQSKGLFALNFSEARVLGDEDDVGSATDRASRRAGWKRRRTQDA